MNNWLQNIKGQITELATEVLNDATEEGQVSASSELQVEKKKCAEAERQCLAEKAQKEALEKRVKELEEQLFSTNVENDAIKEKFMGIVSDREQQIKRLNWEIERFRCSEESEFRSINLESPPKVGSSFCMNAEVENAIAQLKERHQSEMAAVISINATNMQQIREEYEQRIHELESWTSAVAATENVASKYDKNQNEIIVGLRQKVEELQTTVKQLEVLREAEEKLNAEKVTNLEEIRQLKALNAELMASYNETCTKLDGLKNNGGTSNSETVSDLSSKISSLKSMLNETESRYELCKMEQAETGTRLELLLKDFADLRSSMHAAQATAEGNERDLMSEVHSLRDTLEHTKADREKLLNDFRESVRAVGEELTELREYNQRLVNENTQLHESLSQLNALREALNNSNDELSNFGKRFAEMQDNFTKEIERVTAERDQLKTDELDSRKVTEERQCQTDEQKPEEKVQNEEIVEQNLRLKTELSEREEELNRLRNEKLLTAISADEHCKRPSSDTDSAASNNDWERMGKEEIEVEAVCSIAGSDEKEATTKRRQKSSEVCDSATQTDEVKVANEQFDKLTKSESKREKLAEELSAAYLANAQSQQIKQTLEDEICSKNSQIDKLRTEKEMDSVEMDNLLEQNRELEAKLAHIERDIARRNSELLEQEREEIVLLRSETEKLQELLKQKHSECQNYYEQLQAMHTVLQGKDAKLGSAEEVLGRRDQEIALNRERMAKLEGDVQRLREHLLTIEEHSSKDAIAAEERETDLRRQIRVLQEKSTTEGTSLTNSLEHYQLHVGELNAKIEQLENENSRTASLLTEKEKMLVEINKTISNLQNVLKELAEDQKMEKQKLDAELRNIREELKKKSNALAETEEAKANLEDEFANITHQLNLSREQLLRRENLVEELENQLEEMRIAGKHHCAAPSDSSFGDRSGGAPADKIDDATLRQLFLSYFTADKTKQPEIAIVMSRILGYSAEEQSQIGDALSKASSASSWFGFSVHPPANHGPPGISLAEQFVRFLEQESMANAQALFRPPIRSLPPTNSVSFLVGESPQVPTRSPSSSADLKSILEQ